MDFMKRLNTAVLTVILICTAPAHASSVFVGYEFGQMAFNEFQNFAGEIGYSLDNNTAIRLSFLNVALSERHLSSTEASAVDGDNVEGLWRGAELLYDIPLTNHVSISPSIGHFDSEFTHTILGESIRKRSPTVGMALSYSDSSVFGFNNLYWRVSFSYRNYLKPLARTMLGDSVVTGGSSEFTPAIFVGYSFN